MRLLICDTDAYAASAQIRFSKLAGEVVIVPLQELRPSVLESFDVAIVDPFNAFPSSHNVEVVPYGICEDVLTDEWVRSHPLIIYTAQIVDDFIELCERCKAPIEYVVKSRLEVPQVLEFMREHILHSPSIIGLRDRPKVPDAVTERWIHSETALYDALTRYVLKLRLMGEERELDEIESFPRGLVWVDDVCRVESEVLNGGYEQYLSNLDSSRGAAFDECIQRTCNFLRAVNSDLEANVRDAVSAWQEFAKPWQGSSSGRYASAEERAAMSRFEERCEELDREFYQLDFEWAEKIDAYIKTHPEEFIHGIS